jgi:hypothetical protein
MEKDIDYQIKKEELLKERNFFMQNPVSYEEMYKKVGSDDEELYKEKRGN